MKKYSYRIISLLIIFLWMNNAIKAQSPYPSSTEIKDILGIIHQNGKYRFTTGDYLTEGTDEIQNMGTSVLKLFMGKSTALYYPPSWGNTWPTLTTLKALAQTSYFANIFNRTQFKTYVLTAFEMTNPTGNVTNFKDGLSEAEKISLKKEIFDLADYFFKTYPGKTFVLANWEGDGMLGFVNQNPVPPVAQQNIALQGLTDWFNARQDAIDSARNANPTSSAIVVGAAEFNHVNYSVKTYPWRTMLDYVVPNLHMDLYAFSNWKSNTPTTVENFNELMDSIKLKCPSSLLYGANNIYLGETGVFEFSNVTGGEIAAHSDYSDRLGREIMQRNTEMALKAGVRYILHWIIYDNGLRSGVVINPPNEATSDSQLTGTGIRRVDGSYTGIYTYYKSIMSKTLLDYIHLYEAEAQNTTVSSSDTHTDILQSGSSGAYFSKLDGNAVGDFIQYTLRQTQKGLCNVKIKYRKGPTYGKFRLSIGSQTPFAAVDCYNATNTFGEINLGTFQFSNNPGVISYNYKFVVEGKTGIDYDLGIDAIIVEPVNNTPFFNAISTIGHLQNLDVIKQPSLIEQFVVYPNPAADQLSVDLNLNYKLEFFDLLGRRVLQMNTLSGKSDIDVSKLTRGIYIVKAISNGKVYTKKIVLK